METFNKNKIEEEFFEDSDIFKKAEEELKNLVRKSNGKDENLTEKEQKRRNDLYRMLKPPIKDAN
jgi:hypothetical protein